MPRDPSWLWAPEKVRQLEAPMDSDFQTLYLPWSSIERGWPCFAEIEAVRVARRWGGIDMFAWFAQYGGGFLTLRRVW